MPVYDVAAAAEALDITVKQLDNLLVRGDLPSVERRRRGVARRIPTDAVTALRIALVLMRRLHLSVPAATAVARELMAHEGALAIDQIGELRVDLAKVVRVNARRLDEAVESVGRRRRGRPPHTPPSG